MLPLILQKLKLDGFLEISGIFKHLIGNYTLTELNIVWAYLSLFKHWCYLCRNRYTSMWCYQTASELGDLAHLLTEPCFHWYHAQPYHLVLQSGLVPCRLLSFWWFRSTTIPSSSASQTAYVSSTYSIRCCSSLNNAREVAIQNSNRTPTGWRQWQEVLVGFLPIPRFHLEVCLPHYLLRLSQWMLLTGRGRGTWMAGHEPWCLVTQVWFASAVGLRKRSRFRLSHSASVWTKIIHYYFTHVWLSQEVQ